MGLSELTQFPWGYLTHYELGTHPILFLYSSTFQDLISIYFRQVPDQGKGPKNPC